MSSRRVAACLPRRSVLRTMHGISGTEAVVTRAVAVARSRVYSCGCELVINMPSLLRARYIRRDHSVSLLLRLRYCAVSRLAFGSASPEIKAKSTVSRAEALHFLSHLRHKPSRIVSKSARQGTDSLALGTSVSPSIKIFHHLRIFASHLRASNSTTSVPHSSRQRMGSLVTIRVDKEAVVVLPHAGFSQA